METNISQLQVKQQEKYPEILSDDALLFIEKLHLMMQNIFTNYVIIMHRLV